MDAEQLYEFLIGFKQPDRSGVPPQQKLMDYCNQTLGSVEKNHFDYKEKRDRREAKLHDDDKKNLAKAVSGFANSSGGVLIWGIEDESLTPKPITDIQRFVELTLQLASQATDPTVQSITGDWIPADGGTNQEGFGLILIPESSLPPHRVSLKLGEVQNHYYIRSGESFRIATHTQLEDMFGRRPKPILELTKKVEYYRVDRPTANHSIRQIVFHVILGIENKGRGAAKSPYLSIQVNPSYRIPRKGSAGNLALEGRGKFVLEEIFSSKELHERNYGSLSGVVIPSGKVLDVASVLGKSQQFTFNSGQIGPERTFCYERQSSFRVRAD